MSSSNSSVQEVDEDFELLRAVARSEGLNSRNNKIPGYLPLFKHPLPISDARHDHEKILKKVSSCKLEFQGCAAITLGDAWSLEEVYMRNGRIVLQDKNGSSPLHLAVQMNSIDCVMVLINIKVDLSVPNELGFTPLYVAHSAGYNQIVQLLVENKAKMFVDPKVEPPVTTILDVHPERHNSGKIPANNLNSYLKLPDKSAYF